MYEPIPQSSSSTKDSGDGDGDASQSTIKYRKFGLSDEKTFENIFFPSKQPLLQLVDQFRQKKGKFCIPGFPYKLGLLLHGPPGTGKTSMIKALASYTGRSIVKIRLPTIKTNSELMDIFYR